MSKKKLDPELPEERKKIIRESVARAVKEYGEVFKKLAEYDRDDSSV